MIFSDRALSKRIEYVEALANVEIVESHASLVPESGAMWMNVGGAYIFFDGVQSPCTQTFGLGIGEEVHEANLKEIEDFFKSKNTSVYHEISPLADPSLLCLLRDRAYQPIEYSSVMFKSLVANCQIQTTVNPNIHTRIIENDEINLWAETSANGWGNGHPDITEFMMLFAKVCINCKNSYAFLSEINSQSIASGILFIIDNVALIVGDSTLAQGRNQGAQTALINARLSFAKERGCDMAVMVASPGSQSQRNGEKNGFRIAYTRTKWHLSNA
jgi:hypothetical protein